MFIILWSERAVPRSRPVLGSSRRRSENPNHPPRGSRNRPVNYFPRGSGASSGSDPDRNRRRSASDRDLEDRPEHDVQEVPERPGGPRGLGPEQGPLPATEPELGELPGVEVRGDLAGLLRLSQTLSVAVDPALEDFLQPQSEHLALGRHLLRQVA